jgi:lipopolysaccharide/colanic/teichoic acid biosynthesis glycosyltransferase
LTAVLAALPILGVCAAGVALLVRATSPGPIFFRQVRVGYRERPFQLLKFRTMRLDAETVSHRSHIADLLRSNAPMQKLDGRRDPRLIFGGWILRASGMDELPQILNVLRGEMSLVGPRPCLPYELELYGEAQRRRFSVLPGLTGLWQVSGKNRTTFQTMIQLDLAYAERLCLREDLRIMLLTAPTLAAQLGAAAIRRLPPFLPFRAEAQIQAARSAPTASPRPAQSRDPANSSTGPSPLIQAP